MVKQCYICREVKSLQEFYKKAANTDGHQPDCKLCRKALVKNYYEQNREKKLAYAKQRLETHREERKAYLLKSRGLYAALKAKRNAKKKAASPPWLTDLHYSQIKIFYDAAASLTKELGRSFHVDHIVPLQGKNVSGLHVPWNLQVLPAEENISKGNRHG